ncbi:MAG: biotin transporter BioY [Clostridia bacterium]|nr:biotin transporter BioY [Clostridia bacterium]
MGIKTRDMILIAFFSALTAVGAFIKIPMYPVSITLQLFFVILSGMLLPPKHAAFSQILYIFIGLLGIPIFEKGGGISYVLQPSFGFMIGFVIASYIVSVLSSKYLNNNSSFYNTFLICLSGILACYLLGVPYLYIILKHVNGTDITFLSAVKINVIFLPGDILKAAVVALISKKITHNVSRGRLN